MAFVKSKQSQLFNIKLPEVSVTVGANNKLTRILKVKARTANIKNKMTSADQNVEQLEHQTSPVGMQNETATLENSLRKVATVFAQLRGAGRKENSEGAAESPKIVTKTSPSRKSSSAPTLIREANLRKHSILGRAGTGTYRPAQERVGTPSPGSWLCSCGRLVTPPDSRSLRPPRARPEQAGCRRRKFGRAPPPGGALSARLARPRPQDPGPGRRTFTYLLPSLALRCRRCAAHPRCPVSHPQHTDPTRTPEARPQALEVRPRPSHTG
ncbi:uncharacterized protein [Macaca nemestrina]|uniref:uncharacterized protein n=1 Tax=Macaca nemestrina TaxID=9545 RepID=UPI0039B8E70D